jgi:transporter family-2 protein
VTIAPANPTTAGRSKTIALLGLGFLCGAGVAAQSRVNGELGAQIHDGFTAALISFGVGLIIMVIGLAVIPSGRRGLGRLVVAVRDHTIPFWHVLGGACGAFFVLTQGLTAAILGVALFSVGVVAGQTVGGIVVDRRGLGTMPSRPLTIQRVIGSVIALGAAVIAASSEVSGSVPLWMLVLPLLAGSIQSLQQAVNGQVRQVSNSTVTTTFGNFVVGTAVLAVAFLVHSGIVGWPTRFPTDPLLYTGGAIGVIFIAISAAIVRAIGVLLLSLATIAGQLVTSLVIDAIAPTSRQGVTLTTIVGTVLTLAAVVIAAIPRRARSRSR